MWKRKLMISRENIFLNDVQPVLKKLQHIYTQTKQQIKSDRLIYFTRQTSTMFTDWEQVWI